MSASSLADLLDLEEGVLSPRAFVDGDVYQLEMDRIFARQWLYVAHESEVPSPADFVTRRMGEDPVVVARGTDGVVRVLLNACRHRGRQVCVEDKGRAIQLMCPYHGWTYSISGGLIGVPFKDLAQARIDHSYERAFRRYLVPELLLVDDFGLHRLSAQQSSDLYELIIERHRRASFAFTSNRSVDEWLGLFDDPILANSALDRLANGSYQVVLDGPSYRAKLAPRLPEGGDSEG